MNWTIEEACLLKNYYKSGMKIKEIAKKLDRSSNSIKSKVFSIGLIKSGKTKNFDLILKNVLSYSEIDKELLFSKTRKREIVKYRQLCHYYAEELTIASLSTIGSYFGNKDHATVLNSINSVSNYIETDIRFKTIYEELRMLIKNDIIKREDDKIVEIRKKQQLVFIKKSLSNIHSKIEFNDFVKNVI